jgi:hypothetical protein
MMTNEPSMSSSLLRNACCCCSGDSGSPYMTPPCAPPPAWQYVAVSGRQWQLRQPLSVRARGPRWGDTQPQRWRQRGGAGGCSHCAAARGAWGASGAAAAPRGVPERAVR